MLRDMRRFCGFGSVVVLTALVSLTGIAHADDHGKKKDDSKAVSWYEAPSKKLVIDSLAQIAAGWTQLDQEGIDGRPFFSVHRARLWVRGKAHQRVNYVLHLAFDRIGADQYAMIQSKPISAVRPTVVQDALIQYDAFGNGTLRLSAGFLRPNVGRESNTPVPALPTHEPGFTSTLARIATTGAGHGRAGGVNVGGRVKLGPTHVIYNVGAFLPTRDGKTTSGVEYKRSAGEKAAPLVAGSLILALGSLDQMKGGDLLFLPTAWTNKKSLILGGGMGFQGETDHHKKNEVISGFASVHFDTIQVDGEWVKATKESIGGTEYGNTAWHARLSYNIRLKDSMVSPFVLYTQISGDDISADAWGDDKIRALTSSVCLRVKAL